MRDLESNGYCSKQSRDGCEIVALIKGFKMQYLVALRATIYIPDSATASFNPHIADAQTQRAGTPYLDPGIYTGASGSSVSGPWACMHFTRTEVPVRGRGEELAAICSPVIRACFR